MRIIPDRVKTFFIKNSLNKTRLLQCLPLDRHKKPGQLPMLLPAYNRDIKNIVNNWKICKKAQRHFSLVKLILEDNIKIFKENTKT